MLLSNGSRGEGTYICHGNQRRENHGRDPWDAVAWAQRRPCKAEEADCFERGEEEQPPEADFGLQGDAFAALATEVVDGGKIGEIGQEIADQDTKGAVRTT